MSNSIQAKGNTHVIPAGTTSANVANVATSTNTFNFLNASSSVYAYVGVFNTYASAAAMTHPVAGTPGPGVPIAPNQTATITGDFGINPNPGTVYVAAITSTGTTNVFATPITP